MWSDNNGGWVNFLNVLMMLWGLNIPFFDLFYLFLFQLLLLWYQIFSHLIVNNNRRKSWGGRLVVLFLLIYLVGIDHSLNFKNGIGCISTCSILLKRVEWGFPLDKLICCLFRFLKLAIKPKHVVKPVWWDIFRL
jgi:hypothetical protein